MLGMVEVTRCCSLPRALHGECYFLVLVPSIPCVALYSIALTVIPLHPLFCLEPYTTFELKELNVVMGNGMDLGGRLGSRQDFSKGCGKLGYPPRVCVTLMPAQRRLAVVQGMQPTYRS